jgi:dephospho-CoA kinase
VPPLARRPYIIGLTGNIATGKSTVANMLAELGACVIDADRVAHGVMGAGSDVHGRLVTHFGRHILRVDGEIDRGRLGAIVFADPVALQALDAIVHPAVVVETRRRLESCTADVAVVEAVKLLEAGMDRECDAVWVVVLDREVQIERLMQRSGLSRATAQQRVDAQPSQEERAARADVVIDNGGTLAETYAQVLGAWRRISAAGAPPDRGEQR